MFPEFTSEWIVDEIDDFATRKSDPLTLTAEDRATLLEVLPRWKGKSFDKIVEPRAARGCQARRRRAAL